MRTTQTPRGTQEEVTCLLRLRMRGRVFVCMRTERRRASLDHGYTDTVGEAGMKWTECAYEWDNVHVSKAPTSR
jgi:hypothetical protein